MWSPSDEAMLAGLAAGDREAATGFVRRFQARVFGLAYALVGDHAVAEEVAQETFLRAWRHAAAFDPRRGQVATWLLAITRNLAIDRLRVRRTEALDPERLVAMIDLAAGEEETATDAEAPDVRAAVAGLPEEQRRALVLAALFGFTAKEIGELERAPIGTVKTRIRTAMQKVRAELETRDEL